MRWDYKTSDGATYKFRFNGSSVEHVVFADEDTGEITFFETDYRTGEVVYEHDRTPRQVTLKGKVEITRDQTTTAPTTTAEPYYNPNDGCDPWCPCFADYGTALRFGLQTGLDFC